MKLSEKDFEEFTKVLLKNTAELCPPEEQEIVKKITSFRQVLIEESDRGCALMAVAFIDELLIDLLKAYFVENEALTKRLLSSSGSLGSFSSRIDMAYALGLMSKNVVHDLNILRKIRNDFAHVSKPLTFEEDGLRSRCFALAVMPFPAGLKARSRFCRSMVVAANEIEFARLDLTKCQVRANYNGEKTATSLNELKKFVEDRFSVDLSNSM
ncbi:MULTISPECIES: MltR family transcriptional regulator [Vibrio]|uniref:MltR family transcriptional regulator n=1 Tax=Vibrio TaxID=662 RepID=UPI0018696D13|nr:MULTISPECIES: MltR family transcriptional regulator [Vibrio]MBE3654823.1 hypothetical protein [Vibrio navarrensis]MCG3731074.1 hypothetical protein [Vibrio cincinnatiensis]